MHLYFISYLRTIATILITNSHFNNIWPVSSMAAGGLLGNILFFAVSGYCLLNVKDGFGKWYSKRVLRIYPIVIIFTFISIGIGDYSLTTVKDAVYLFLYPTIYVFVLWILIAYVVFYVVARCYQKYSNFLEWSLAFVILLWFTIYLFFVDKSSYCIDDVESPFILFLYFSSMLIGALFKKYEHKFKRVKFLNVIALFISLILYFGSKIAFSKITKIVFLQIFNQIFILIALIFTFMLFVCLEEKLKKLPKLFNSLIKFIGNITLHIYVSQFIIIRRFEVLTFPINLILTTIVILLVASFVFCLERYVREIIAFLIKLKKERKNEKSNN